MFASEISVEILLRVIRNRPLRVNGPMLDDLKAMMLKLYGTFDLERDFDGTVLEYEIAHTLYDENQIRKDGVKLNNPYIREAKVIVNLDREDLDEQTSKVFLINFDLNGDPTDALITQYNDREAFEETTLTFENGRIVREHEKDLIDYYEPEYTREYDYDLGQVKTTNSDGTFDIFEKPGIIIRQVGNTINREKIREIDLLPPAVRYLLQN